MKLSHEHSVSPDAFLNAMRRGGVQRFASVPCSVLRELMASSIDATSLMPNEGEALAYAAGAWIAGESVGVMVQNSGIGNLFNALTSLCQPYKIPALLIVGWRGAPSSPDEQQHELMGSITPNVLRAAGVVCHVLDERNALDIAYEAADAVYRGGGVSHAILVPPRSFQRSSEGAPSRPARRVWPSPNIDDTSAHPVASREEVMRVLTDRLKPGVVLIASTGFIGREAFALSDRVFPMAGSMGHALAFGCGIASARAGPVAVVDGDGSLLMRLSGLALPGVGASHSNLIHIVLDNECHESTGGQSSLSPGVNLCRIAAACGYKVCRVTTSLDDIAQSFGQFAPGDGPVFLHVPVLTSHKDPPRVAMDLSEIADRFRKQLKTSSYSGDHVDAAE